MALKSMDEYQKSKVKEFVANLVSWLPILEEKMSVRMSFEEIVMALVTELNLELLDIACKDFGLPEMMAFLEGSEYVKGLPVIEEKIVVEESVIPTTVVRLLLEEQVRLKGEIWIVHKGDADPFPSNPHAHNYESGLKMHLGTGELFRGTELVGKSQKKQFLELRQRFKSVKLPELSI